MKYLLPLLLLCQWAFGQAKQLDSLSRKRLRAAITAEMSDTARYRYELLAAKARQDSTKLDTAARNRETALTTNMLTAIDGVKTVSNISTQCRYLASNFAVGAGGTVVNLLGTGTGPKNLEIFPGKPQPKAGRLVSFFTYNSGTPSVGSPTPTIKIIYRIGIVKDSIILDKLILPVIAQTVKIELYTTITPPDFGDPSMTISGTVSYTGVGDIPITRFISRAGSTGYGANTLALTAQWLNMPPNQASDLYGIYSQNCQFESLNPAN